MLKLNDLYTYHTVQSLEYVVPTTTVTKRVGTTIISYEIRPYRDVRNLSEALAYQVLCTQRIVIPNQKPYTPGGLDVEHFHAYPAVVMNQISLTATESGTPTHPELVSYSPRTLNASVVTSVSSGSGTSGAATMQHTNGSSTSQSNSFGASASLGFFGDVVTGGLSIDYEHGWGSEQSRSASAGSETGSSRHRDSSESMSVKDWACYASLDPHSSSPTWVWGQEYPWNVIQYRNTLKGSNITLPNFVTGVLYDGTQLFPPSELSQFGIDFTMKAVWIVKTTAPVDIVHTVNYYTAYHKLVGTDIQAGIHAPHSFTCGASNLDLCRYGLDPVPNRSSAAGAIVGFIPGRFLVPPSPAVVSGSTVTPPTAFKIISSGNNLLIEDRTSYAGLTTADDEAGFSAFETALTAKFTQNCPALTMRLSFKIIDTSQSYQLYLKHWKSHPTGVMLSLVFNGDTSRPLVKYVDAFEAEGGENNLLTISLRNLNYGSVDYHDYLQLGLNTIDITLTPIGGSAGPCRYQVRAISIERE